MRVDELLKEEKPLLEGLNLSVFEALIPHLLINEDDGGGDIGGGDIGEPPGNGGTPPDVTPPTPPVQPPGGGGWWRPRPVGGFGGGRWFNELYNSLKFLAIASNLNKRLKELGISGEGAKRVKMAQKVAAKNVKLILNNPGAVAYRIPVWTTQKPPKPVIKMWNEAFSREFAKELSKIELISEETSSSVMSQAATWLETSPDKLERVGGATANGIAETSKQLKRNLIKSAAGNWVVILYQHTREKFVRVESPDGENITYRAGK